VEEPGGLEDERAAAAARLGRRSRAEAGGHGQNGNEEQRRTAGSRDDATEERDLAKRHDDVTVPHRRAGLPRNVAQAGSSIAIVARRCRAVIPVVAPVVSPTDQLEQTIVLCGIGYAFAAWRPD
jgi:hypothetical protein